MFKHFIHKAFVIALIPALASLVSCEIIKGPNFSNTPKISFERFNEKRNVADQLGNRVDSIIIVIDFEDGDGDLGLTPDERVTNDTYKQYNKDGTPNKFWYNYFVRVFRKQNGSFTEFFPAVPYSGAFPPLKPDGKPGPIEGKLEYDLTFPLFSSPPNDTLQFEIQIADKALNLSNIIRTEPVVINRK